MPVHFTSQELQGISLYLTGGGNHILSYEPQKTTLNKFLYTHKLVQGRIKMLCKVNVTSGLYVFNLHNSENY